MENTVEFAGICTHFQSDPRFTHRVILMENAKGTDGIDPHHARLSIRQTDLRLPSMYAAMDGWLSWMLHGVQIRIAGGVGGLTYQDWDSLPKVPRDAVPRDEVIIEGKETAAWFDLTSGELRPICHGKATGVQAKIKGDDLRLVMRTFKDGTEVSLPLRDGAQVRVQNTAAPMHHHNDKEHFRLHCRAFHPMPCPPPPKECSAPRCGGGESIFGPVALGAGCSNNGFP